MPPTDKDAVAVKDDRYAVETKHEAVAGFAPPRNHLDGSAATGNSDTKADPVPSIVETATPRIAAGVADLDAERDDPDGAVRKANARERALAGHRAPDTVDLPEAQARVEDNRAALDGLGGVPTK
jgi:hypothetical protein